MTKAQLESKHIAELHELAADAGVERYRMLSRAELIEKLAGEEAGSGSKPKGESRGGGSGQRRQRDRGRRNAREPRDGRRGEQKQPDRESRRGPAAESESAERKPEPPAAPATTPSPSSSRPKRKRRRRWGRRRKGARVHDLLLPAAPGRQALVYAESRAACTALLREIAAELSGASGGPDPIALLIDPTPEELAEWKREAPRAEIVSAGKAQHAGDALAQARNRANGGEDVIVLIDSLTRFAEDFAGIEEARELFDAGRGGSGGGSLTVVAALERPA